MTPNISRVSTVDIGEGPRDREGGSLRDDLPLIIH